MSHVDELFTQLREQKRKALMPFVTAGDPNLDTTRSILAQVGQAGADLCEVGVPYSDPIADGPVIQASYQRALDGGFRLEGLFDLPKAIPADGPPTPLVTMASYSILYRMGLDAYVQRAKQAGYSGAIVPDLLVEEADPLVRVCREHDFSLIQLVTPTTPQERQVAIANTSTGFLYYVSVTGITGERKELPPELAENVAWLRNETDLPICIGFGISGPETAAQLAPVADGLIVGSALVRRIAEASDQEAAVQDATSFIAELRDAIDSATG